MIDDIDNIHRLVDARINVVSVKPSPVVVPKPRRNHKRVWAGVGALSVSFVLGLSIFFPVFNKQSGYDILSDMISKDSSSVATGDISKEPNPIVKDMPYVWIPTHGMGTFGYWRLNETFYRNWLNNTVSWKVQKSVDGLKWTDYQKFIVKKDWNSVDLTEKHTIIVTADEEAYYRVLTNTKTDKQLVDYTDDSKNNSFSMRFKVSESKDYTLLYNWSDYSKSAEASKTTLSKSIKTDSLSAKQYFEWMVVSSSKLKKDEVFTVDPVYGTIGDAVTDSWEWDTEEGRIYATKAAIRLGTSNYYAIAFAGDDGTSYDGHLRTVELDGDDTFPESIIDNWEFDTADGRYMCIIHISSDIYAILHRAGNPSAIGKIITVRMWDTNGTIQKSAIDSINLPYQLGQGASFTHVSGDIYACAYQEPDGGFDFQLETFQISNAGVITDAHKDIEEFDSTPSATQLYTSCVMVDSDTIAVAYNMRVPLGSYYGYVKTFDINSTGSIGVAIETKTVSGGGSYNSYPFIHHIYGTIYAVVLSDASNKDGYIKTFTISNAGDIQDGANYVDFLEFENADMSLPTIFTINEPTVATTGVYAIVFKDVDGDGEIYTLNITYTGDIAATRNDYLEFDTADYSYQSPLIQMSGNYYVIFYQGTDADGWAKIFTIETYQAPAWSNVCPIAKGEHPSNSSTNVVLKPAVGCTITDSNSNHTMNVTFATNRSGSWVNKQTNSSVANNSKVNWTYLQANSASTSYWWRMYVHDGFCNQSFTYKFTTAANASAESWKIINNTINGGGYNITSFKILDNTINGVAFNTTSFKILDNTKNGSAYNESATWKITDSTIDGSAYNNSAAFKIINSTINGAAYNLSSYHVLQSLSGSAFNSSSYHILDSAVNGLGYNSSSYHILDSMVNGSAFNLSSEGWKTVNDTIDGICFNSTAAWHILDNTVNGSCYNSSAESWKIINNTINGAAFNLTSWHIVDNTINGLGFNLSSYHILDNIVNGSAYNLSSESWKVINNTFNGSAYNISNIHLNITNPYPSNNSVVHSLYPSICFTINHTKSLKMNYSVYIGNSTVNTTYLLGSGSLVNNGTFCLSYSNASSYSTFYWKVVVNSSGESLNETFVFSISNITGGVVMISFEKNNMWLITGLLIGLLPMFIIIKKRRKKKNGYRY